MKIVKMKEKMTELQLSLWWFYVTLNNFHMLLCLFHSPISSYFMLPENMRKTEDFRCFHKVWKETSSMKWVNFVYDFSRKATFILTGISIFRAWKASITFNQHKTGPLSSVDPRPYNLPSFSISSNGSLSHPSDFFAGCTSKWPYTQTVFFDGSEPRWPSIIGGNGIVFPSGDFCSFKGFSQSSMVASSSSNCYNQKSSSKIKGNFVT